MTNFASSYSELQTPITAPTVTVCIPQMKKLAMAELNITKMSFILRQPPPNMTMSEAFDKVTFKLGQDFDLKMFKTPPTNNFGH